MPITPDVSVVAAVTAVDGAPVSLASRFVVVPVVLALARVIVMAEEDAPSDGLVKVGALASTSEPLPLVPLDRSEAEGCEEAGTPVALMVLIHWCATAE